MKKGFTLVELMITVAIFALAMGGSIGVFIMCQKMWHATSLGMKTNRDCNLAMSRLVYGMGSNSGLRSAGMVTLSTNFHGWPFTMQYWETYSNPPPADATTHHICSCGSYPRDGSWRLTLSNAIDGVKYIEYNAPVRSLLFCSATNLQSNARLTTEAERQRISIGNYVSSAVVSTNTDGINIRLTLLEKDGRFTATNSVSTFVLMRNRKE